MRPARPAMRRLLPALLLPVLLAPALLALGSAPALPQSAIAPGQGSLPPPRPLQNQPATSAPAPAPAAAPRPPQAPRPAQAPRPPAQTPQAQRPAQTPQAERPAQAPQAQRPAQAPQAQRPAQRPGQRPAQPPTVGQAQPPPNRRPGAAAAAAGVAAGVAAGAAAGAAGSGAASAAARAPSPAATPPMPATGSVTGLPLPRFAALRSDEVNMRVGPSTSYPIEWTFQRRDLPVQIVGEFQLWRRIRDADGAEGWVHSSTLAGRRTTIIRPVAAAPESTLRRRPEEGGVAVARLRPGVIARLRECEAGNPWCEVQVAGHRGWLRRAEMWGIGPEEEVK